MVLLSRVFIYIAAIAAFASFPSNSYAEKINSLTLPATGNYNGFNNHINNLECINLSSTEAIFSLQLLRSNGSSFYNKQFGIAPKGSIRLNLDSLTRAEGKTINNSYGQFRINEAREHTEISCISVVQKFQNSALQYSMTLPVGQRLAGPTYGLYNSHDPSGGATRTQNWLSITNPESSVISGNIEIYDYYGNSVKKIPYSISGFGRYDFEIGSENGQATGLYKITPNNNSPYGAFLARYNSFDNVTFNFASSFNQTKHSCSSTISASSMGNADNWLELGSLSSRDNEIRVTVRSRDGEILFQQNQIIPKYSQHHIFLNQYIDPEGTGNIGNVFIECLTPGAAVIAQSAFYGKGLNNNISWSFASQATSLENIKDSSSFAAFVNAEATTANWLKVKNTTNQTIELDQRNHNALGTEVSRTERYVAANSSIDVALHEITADHSLKSVHYNLTNASEKIDGEVLRVYYDAFGNILEIVPTPIVVYGKGESTETSDSINDDIADNDGDGIPNSIDKCQDFFDPSSQYENCYDPEVVPTLESLSEETGEITIGNQAYEVRNSGITLYVISKGDVDGDSIGDTWVNTQFLKENNEYIFQIKDPDENIIFWENNLKDGSKLTTSIENKVPKFVNLAKKGVYQFIIFNDEAGHKFNQVNFKMSPGTEYGVLFQNGSYAIGQYGASHASWLNRPDTLYAWAPVNRNANMILTLRNYSYLFRSSDEPLPFKVYDETRGNLNITNNGKIIIPKSDSLEGHILRFELTENQPWRMIPKGFPLILTKTRAAAEKIHASIERVENGPFAGMLVAHKAQKEIAELIEVFSTKINPSAFNESDIQRITSYPLENTDCSEAPSPEQHFRNSKLFAIYDGTITAAVWSLKNGVQELNPNSKWYGALGIDSIRGVSLTCQINEECSNGASCQGGLCSNTFDDEKYPWDLMRDFTFEGESQSFSRPGLSMYSNKPAAMAWAALNDSPCNPFSPNSGISTSYSTELFNRAALASIVDSLALKESYYWNKSEPNSSLYNGRSDFVRTQTLTSSFSEIAPSLKEFLPENYQGEALGKRLQKLWAKLHRGAYDKSYYEQIVSARNQTAHRLMALRNYYKGLKGLPYYEDYTKMTRHWAKRFVDTFHAAGFAPESAAVDATYNGITHGALADYVFSTKEDSLGEDFYVKTAIEKSYDFFTHTLAIEPSGLKVGPSVFSHRTSYGFEYEQWGGAKNILDDTPIVAALGSEIKDSFTSRSTLSALSRHADLMGTTYRKSGAPSTHYESFSPETRRSALLPAQESGSYFRTFGDEDDIQMLAVKTPVYSTSIYLGTPAPSYFYAGERNIPYYKIANNQHIKEGLSPSSTSLDGNIGIHGPALSVDGQDKSIYGIAPFIGGGLNQLSSPAFGASILAMNWSPKTHHGLIADIDGERLWADYFNKSYSLNESHKELTVYGELMKKTGESQSVLEFSRKYTFNSNHIAVTLKVTARENISFSNFIENIPLATCTRDECQGAEVTINGRTQSVNNIKLNDSSIYINNRKTDEAFSTETNLVSLKDKNSNQTLIYFSSPQTISGNPHGLRSLKSGNEKQVGWIEVHLPENLRAGQTHTLNYSIYIL